MGAQTDLSLRWANIQYSRWIGIKALSGRPETRYSDCPLSGFCLTQKK